MVTKKVDQLPKPKKIKAYYLIFPDHKFCGVSAGVNFTNGKSDITVSDPDILKKFKNVGYETELVKDDE